MFHENHRVGDEKDARGYLQALATKMTDELEGLKMSGIPSAVSNNSFFLILDITNLIAVIHYLLECWI